MEEQTITVEELDRIDAYCAKAVDGPWFVAGDKAEDCSPHTDSGLALVDTGRSADWTIARLCQWHEAEFIAAARTDLPRLSAATRELIAENERLDNEPRLGCATTRQLLEELTARIEIHHSLDYRTVDPPMNYGPLGDLPPSA